MFRFRKTAWLLFFVLLSHLAIAQIQDSLVKDSPVRDSLPNEVVIDENKLKDTTLSDEYDQLEEIKVKKTSIFSGKPGKSLLFSLVIPGSGQLYNKSYLRLPFVYAVIGGAGYNLYRSTRIYNCYSDAYVAAVDGVPYVKPPKCNIVKNLELITDAGTLRVERDNANDRRQLAIVLFALAWLANGIDAYVDSHLKSFDMDESLSIDLGPIMDEDPAAPFRMGLVLKF